MINIIDNDKQYITLLNERDERGAMPDIKTVRKFAFDVGWVFAGSMVGLVLNFLKKPVMARFLGPEGLGLFSMVTMIAGIITLIAGLGFNSAIIKYTAQHKDDRNRLSAIVSSGIVTMAILGVFASITLFVLSNTLADVFNMPSLSFLLKIYAGVFPFSLIFGVLLALFNGLREMKHLTFIDILNKIMIFSFTLILLFLGFGVIGALIGDMLALFIVVIIAAISMKKFVNFKIYDFKGNTKMLTAFGSRMMGANSINLIQYQADSFLIGYFLTASDLGYYTAAVSLSRFFWRVPQSIQMVTYPATSEYWSKDKRESLNKMIDKSMKYSACILLPVGLAVWFFAKDIVTFLFGDEFIYAVLPLQILLIGTVFSGITNVPIGGSLAGAGRPDLALKFSGISSLINIILNLCLIPILGISGAAIATTTSLMIGALIFLFLTVRITSIKIDIKWYTKILILLFIIILFFYIFKRFLSVYLVGCSAIIIFISLIFKIFLTRDDKNIFISIFKSMLHSTFRR